MFTDCPKHTQMFSQVKNTMLALISHSRPDVWKTARKQDNLWEITVWMTQMIYI